MPLSALKIPSLIYEWVYVTHVHYTYTEVHVYSKRANIKEHILAPKMTENTVRVQMQTLAFPGCLTVQRTRIC